MARDKSLYTPFKHFFKLKLSNKPYAYRKVLYETYKRNPTLQKTNKTLWGMLGILGLFFIFPGTRIPLQLPLKLTYVKFRLALSERRYRWDKTDSKVQSLIKTTQKLILYMDNNDMLEEKPVAFMLNFLTLLMYDTNIIVYSWKSLPKIKIVQRVDTHFDYSMWRIGS